MNERAPRRGGGAALIAAGILLSRVFGLVRNRLLGHYLGAGDAMDALTAAFRFPNFLQNLFGEGVLSASFIPVYARLLAEGDEVEAGRVAGAIGALLALTSTVLVLLGIVLAPVIVPLVVAPGFLAEKRDLTVLLVQITFPGVGLLVLSAWTLGILNSHRRFFLSYASPVAMNIVIIGVLLWRGSTSVGEMADQASMAAWVAWASVVGSVAQVMVQLPTVLRVERRMRVRFAVSNPHVLTVLRNFLPVFIGRGVVQLSALADGVIASLLPGGAVAILGYAQVITVLPVSLFGMSVSAAELPAMSSELGSEEAVAAALRRRLHDGLHRIAFYVVPSAVAFLVLGDIVGGLLYQTGRLGRTEMVWLWSVLAGSAVGLLAGTLGRLYASTFYALRDTRTPFLFATLRVTLTIVLGVVASLWVPGWIGIAPKWGVAGLTVSAGIAAWLEFFLLRRALARRIGDAGVGGRYVGRLWLCAAVSALPALGAKLVLGTGVPVVLGCVALPLYGFAYFTITSLLGVEEAQAMMGRLRRLVARG